jgi:hypothetical protein
MVDECGLPPDYCCPMREIDSAYIDADYGEAYSYGYGYESTRPEEPGNTGETATDDVMGARDAAQEAIPDDPGEYAGDDENWYEDEFGNYGMESERADVTTETAEVKDTAPTSESNPYVYDEYMYEDEFDNYGMEGETADTTAETAEVKDTAPTSESDPYIYDEYMYEDEFGNYGMEGEQADVTADTAEVQENVVISEEQAYDYDEYLFEEEYGYFESEGEEAEVSTEAAGVEASVLTREEDSYKYDEFMYEDEYGNFEMEGAEASISTETPEIEERAVTPGQESFEYDEYMDEEDYDWSHTGRTTDSADAADESDAAEAGNAEATEAAALDTQSQGSSGWTYEYSECYGYPYGFAEENSQSTIDQDVAEVEQPAEPETPADYAEWVEDYGYDANDEWLVGDVAGKSTDEDLSPVDEAPAAPAYQGDAEAYPDEQYAYPESGWEGMSHYDEFGYEAGDREFGHGAAPQGFVPDEFESEEAAWDNPTTEEAVSGEADWEIPAADETNADESPADDSAETMSEGAVRYESWNGYQYEYYYPEDEVSETVGEPTDHAAAAPEPQGTDRQSGLELFARTPAELLTWSDQELLRALEVLCEEPSAVRRATLNDYLVSVGDEALEFSSRFEDTTGIEVLGLADDLPGTAALLATFRLIERGELGIDEGASLLQRSLRDLPAAWIKGVQAITADAFEQHDEETGSSSDEALDVPGTSWSSPLTDAMTSLAIRSLAGVSGAILEISGTLLGLDWESLVLGSSNNRAAD